MHLWNKKRRGRGEVYTLYKRCGKMGRLAEFIIETIETFYKRNSIYSNAWESMDVSELAAFIRGKAARVCALLENNCSKEKILDDLRDIINYCAMVAVKLNKNTKYEE